MNGADGPTTTNAHHKGRAPQVISDMYLAPLSIAQAGDDTPYVGKMWEKSLSVRPDGHALASQKPADYQAVS